MATACFQWVGGETNILLGCDRVSSGSNQCPRQQLPHVASSGRRGQQDWRDKADKPPADMKKFGLRHEPREREI